MRALQEAGFGQQGETSETAAPKGQHILVAEDSSITQDLLKLVLSQHGHQVDIVTDGREALEALLAHDYDLALLDFHLPYLDGVEVLSAFKMQVQDRKHPCFVALTADVEGLLAHEGNCESFDRIIPKPVDIQLFLDVIDEAGQQRASGFSDPFEPNPDDRDARVEGKPQEKDAPLAAQNWHFLRWPDELDPATLPGRSFQAISQHGEFDAVLITEPARIEDLDLLWQASGTSFLPIVDMTGTLGPAADIDASRLAVAQSAKIDELIEAFHLRLGQLHRDIRVSDRISDKILGRIFVSDSVLKPGYSAQSRKSVQYNLALDPEIVIREADQLLAQGLLKPTFFDRISLCASCGGSNFNVREECPRCASANLTEESYIHHFKCAHQAPEADFRQGDELICPKCRQKLVHFGTDYDKPGTIIACGACGHASSEPNVGFMCLHCGAHTDGDAIRTQDLFEYQLTDRGLAYLRSGNGYFGVSQKVLRFADLPLDLVVALNEEARQFNESGTPFSLLGINYQHAWDIEREFGPRQFSKTRDLFLEILRTFFANGMNGVGEASVVKGISNDFALLRNAEPEAIRNVSERFKDAAIKQLRFDLGVTISVFGPKDLA